MNLRRMFAGHAAVALATAVLVHNAEAAFPPLAPVTKVTAGRQHACAIGAGGSAHCWGQPAFFGSLGRTTFHGVAAPVEELPPVIDIAAGTSHTCAVTQRGSAHCWGYSLNGQLGTGDTFNSWFYPVTVSGLGQGVAAIATGAYHTCALTTGGAAKCWGDNQSGQVGNSSQTQANAPVDVVGIASGATRVAAGGGHSCAVVAGAAKCWGGNFYGQLGDASTDMRLTPVQVQGIASGVTRIAAGLNVSCAVHAGAAKCWGHNGSGQLGDGIPSEFRAVPANVAGLASGITDVAVGYAHACAVRDTGQLYCWGSNFASQLGDGTQDPRSTPVLVTAVSGSVVAVAVGDDDTCALLAAGTVECFGSNAFGQLGFGSLDARFSPVDAAVGAGALTSMAGGSVHGCGVSAGGVLRCWGGNAGGQIGDGTRVTRPFPVTVPLAGAARVTAGFSHSCAATTAGQAFCWGQNSSGQLGIGNPPFGDQLLPVQLTSLGA